MSVVSVSNQSQFLSALKVAKGGDTIRLNPGEYGTISLDGMRSATKYLKYSSEVTVESANSANKAIIDGLTLRGVENLTFTKINFDYDTSNNSNGIPFFVNNSEDVTFRGNTFGGELNKAGYGKGVAFKVSQGSDIMIENSTLSGFRNGIEAWAVEGLTIRNNTLQGIAYDGVMTSNVQGLTIRNNKIGMRSDPAGDQHRDGIQIWNQHERAPSSNIVIDKNTITSTDTTTHGIYMGNADARNTGSLSEYYSNVTISNNTIMTGQKLGIAVGETRGLTITGNTMIQNDALHNNSKPITIPIIHVDQDARNVVITNNIVNGAPIAADANWQKVSAGTAWTISGNTVVGLSWSPSDASASAGTTSTSTSAASTLVATDAPGNGLTDEFRFKGTSVTTDRTDLVGDLRFDEHDTIVLINYEADTFKGVQGGNALEVDAAGSYAKIDSISDLQELVATSSKLDATVIGDTLTLHVAQGAGVHDIVLHGLGEQYLATYDATLF
jgi:nitrous oxidase accessory protein NosD